MSCHWLESVARRALAHGGVVVHATEGVFGLGCAASDRAACRRLAHLKTRGASKPFIVVAAAISQITALIDVSQVDLDRIGADWPGPETWILPAADGAPPWLVSTRRTIAVRVTAHPQFSRLATMVGPMISTSANPPGRPPALNLLTARRYFGAQIDTYLPGTLQTPGSVSRIRDSESGVAVRG